MNNSEMREVIIFEHDLTGHHGVYLVEIVSGYASREVQVQLVISTDSLKHDAIERIRAIGEKYLRIAAFDFNRQEKWLRSLGHSGSQLAFWLAFRRMHRSLASSAKPAVLLPYADYLVYAIGLLGSPFGSSKWKGICVRPSFHLQKLGIRAPAPRLAKVKEWLFKRACLQATLSMMYTIDPLLAPYLQDSAACSHARLTYLPEPVANVGSEVGKIEAKALLGIPACNYVILVYGVIDERKGLRTLIGALSQPNVPRQFHLLIAGLQTATSIARVESTEAALLKQQGRVTLANEFVSQELEEKLFLACDCVWLGYEGHYGMSSVMLKAAKYRREVLATRDGLIGYFTEKHTLGKAIDASNIASVRAELDSARLARLNCDPAANSLPSHDWETALRVICAN
jgi:glycosyltransferase involved in cell wall biosynthesis